MALLMCVHASGSWVMSVDWHCYFFTDLVWACTRTDWLTWRPDTFLSQIWSLSRNNLDIDLSQNSSWNFVVRFAFAFSKTRYNVHFRRFEWGDIPIFELHNMMHKMIHAEGLVAAVCCCGGGCSAACIFCYCCCLFIAPFTETLFDYFWKKKQSRSFSTQVTATDVSLLLFFS